MLRERGGHIPSEPSRVVLPASQIVRGVSSSQISADQAPSARPAPRRELTQRPSKAKSVRSIRELEGEVGGVVDVVPAAVERGIVRQNAGYVSFQDEQLTTVGVPVVPTQVRSRPDSGFPKRYDAHQIDKEGWFQEALGRAREGEWQPLMDYFGTFVQKPVLHLLRMRYGLTTSARGSDQTTQAEDILQDAWVKTIRHFPRLDFPTGNHFHAWFNRLVMNRVNDHATSSSSRRGLRVEERLIEDVSESVAPDEMALAQRDEVLGAFQGLESDLQRQVLQLRIVSEYPISAVAQILGITEGAVKSLQRRGLASIKRALTDLE